MDLSGYAVDGITPSRVERPATAEDVAALIGAAHRDRHAVVVHGGRTRIGIGDAPSRYDVALDMRGLRGIVDHSAPDLVCTVRAGTTLAELASVLAVAGQRWPVDVADPDQATVGGTIASAAPAASRLRHQHVRDWIIGCEAVLGDGTQTRAGGKVVKNVTGYDLTRLYSGTYGTLAAITEVSLKLVATDERAVTMRLRNDPARFDGMASLDLEAIALELRAEFPFEAMVFVGGRDPTLYVRAAGASPAVDRVTESAFAMRAAEVGEDAWSTLKARLTRDSFVARLSVPPGREMEFLVGEGHAYVGTGLAFLFGERTNDELAAQRARCEAVGGALIIERTSPAQRRSVGTWGTSRVPAAIARALKQRFDPHDVLAPGRMP